MKRSQKLLLLLALGALVVGLGMSGPVHEQQVSRKEIPEAVLAAFAKTYPNAKIKGYSRELENGQTFYEIECVEGKTKRDVTYAADGTLISVEETLDTSELPAEVKAAVDRKFPGGKILRTERVSKGPLVGYEFKVRHNGKTTEIVFDAEGNELEM